MVVIDVCLRMCMHILPADVLYNLCCIYYCIINIAVAGLVVLNNCQHKVLSELSSFMLLLLI